jgi:2-oxoglutarate dehydrogenase E2 component (dihydrolipoamide succinyltransferase)
MSIAIKVPAVGESITEVTIGQWFKNEGDYVEMDEVICELESDKATFELTAEAAGVLHIKAEEGETLDVIPMRVPDEDVMLARPALHDR